MPNAPLPLTQRLVLSATDFLSAYSTLAALVVFRQRDEDGPITPEEDKEKLARLIVSAYDEGRTKPYAPIRNVRLELAVRANARVAAGKADPFHAIGGALEALLGSDLQAGFSSVATRGLLVMLAVPRAGIRHRVAGDIREDCWVIETRCVPAELVAG